MRKIRCVDGGWGLIQAYRVKVIISGDVVEMFTYPHDCIRGYNISQSAAYFSGDSDSEISQDRSEYSNLRAQRRIRNLVNCNFFAGNKMLTLTFSSPNMQNLDNTNPIFHSFIRKLKAYCCKMRDARPRGIPILSWRDFTVLRYIAVVEWQSDLDFHANAKKNGGNVHYHLILNIPYIDKDEINELWGSGFVKLKRISDKKNVGAYFAKHGTKHNPQENVKLKGRKKFFSSRGLAQPVELYDSAEISDFFSRSKMVKEFERDVKSGDVVVVKYQQFKLVT